VRLSSAVTPAGYRLVSAVVSMTAAAEPAAPGAGPERKGR
jgi:hypothetical protein